MLAKVKDHQGSHAGKLWGYELEYDACGVGFVVNIRGEKSNTIVRQALQVLANLVHRGACGCDPLTGDGAGLLIQISHPFFSKVLRDLNIELPPAGEYAVGMVFLPRDSEGRAWMEKAFSDIAIEEGQRFLGWRDVPTSDGHIGRLAREAEPLIRQVFIARGNGVQDTAAFERKLYVIRRRIENTVQNSGLPGARFFHVPSLSTRTIVYKGQLIANQIEAFYPDLGDLDMMTSLAVVHSRYSTNTLPSWDRAHPYRYLAHNGEINTLRGNINWMHVREMQCASGLFGDDFKKLFPVLTPGGSDSQILDNTLELLVASGRSLPHAIMMLIPEAWSGDQHMEEEKKGFYEYHACMMEPWDGPASIAFTDGRYVGAVLDRNGLRPSRFVVTKDDLVVMASEVGVLDIPPGNVRMKGRLQPGKMFLVDTVEKRIIDDQEIKQQICKREPYGRWVKENMVRLESLPKPSRVHSLDVGTILERQRAFGYTSEDLKFVLQPMAMDGEEAIGSMGADLSLAVLSNKPQLLYSYFKQLFAQVTNPPIDAIREELIMGEDVFLGPELNLLSEMPEHACRLKLSRPILTNKDLEKIRLMQHEKLRAMTLPILFRASDGVSGLETSLGNLFTKASQAIRDGYSILILSDRGVDRGQVPIPSLLAAAGLHHHLIREGTRTKVSLVAESGEAREMHHFALLIGYGANAVNPYLVYETYEHEINRGVYPDGLTYEKAEKNFLKACRKGLFKVISKMGISTIQSYCGAQIFEAVGLGEKLVEKYFTATVSRIGGIGIETVAEEALARHQNAYPAYEVKGEILDAGGRYAWRKDGEYHQYNPETIALLQHAVRSGDYGVYKQYAKLINDPSKNMATLRSLLCFKKGNPIPLQEVESAGEIAKRFATGAMSYGSISKEAHETLAVAMNRLGGFSNTGEGGEDTDRFKRDPNGDWRRSRIKQVAQGRFGVTINYLVNADQLQIKMAQGAKPGEGGQLPGRKVSKEIAKTRYTTPGVGLISPPPHHDIYSIEDLAQLIFDLKNSNRRADVSVKLVAEYGVGTVAAGVAKGKSDHVLISGHDGGTGASPLTSIMYAGLPWELGLAETQQILVMNDLRGRIRVQTDGQLKTGRDVVIASLIGADEFGFSTSALIASGCVMLRKCHLNTCSVGVATQDPELRKQFAGRPEHVVNLLMFVAEECREIMAELGFRSMSEMTGRVDMLEMNKEINHWKASKLDFSFILHKLETPASGAIRHSTKQQHGLETVLDNRLLELANLAVDCKLPVKLDHIPIRNTDRATGTMLSSEVARRHGEDYLPEDTLRILFKGSAGQSFGAFLAKGVHFTLEGDANDYIGKGLSGGRLVVYPPKESSFAAEENVLIGNVALYGAISGEAFFRGIAGERFCVRNSGVHAVVEGVGEHGCEYMTGGRVVVLGETGRNFAAGMSGGIAYVWDIRGNFKTHCNLSMVDLEPVEFEEDEQELKRLVERHFQFTESAVAKRLLDHWEEALSQFVKVYPQDYRRVIEEAHGIKVRRPRAKSIRDQLSEWT